MSNQSRTISSVGSHSVWRDFGSYHSTSLASSVHGVVPPVSVLPVESYVRLGLGSGGFFDSDTSDTETQQTVIEWTYEQSEHLFAQAEENYKKKHDANTVQLLAQCLALRQHHELISAKHFPPLNLHTFLVVRHTAINLHAEWAEKFPRLRELPEFQELRFRSCVDLSSPGGWETKTKLEEWRRHSTMFVDSRRQTTIRNTNEGMLLTDVPSISSPAQTIHRDWNDEYHSMRDTYRGQTLPKAENLKIVELMMRLEGEFVDFVEKISRIIISELPRENTQRTIMRVSVAGSATPTYITEGVLFRLGLDTHNTFGGDMFAMKALKLEFRNINHLCDVCASIGSQDDGDVSVLRPPLTAVVDYLGHRVFAMAVPPTLEDSLCYGSIPNRPIVTRPYYHSLMKDLCRQLNLKSQQIFDSVTGDVKNVHGPAGIEIHKARDTGKYVLCCTRLFPPTQPRTCTDTTQHQHFRPEFLIRYKHALSSDAFCQVVPEGQLGDAYNKDVQDAIAATQYLENRTVRALARHLDERFADLAFDRLDWSTQLHVFGVNMRYLGLVRSRLGTPHLRTLCLVEIVARTLKNLLRRRWRSVTLSPLPVQFQQRDKTSQLPLLQATVEFLNLAFSPGLDADNFWADTVRPVICECFPGAFAPSECGPSFDMRTLLPMTVVLSRLNSFPGLFKLNTESRQSRLCDLADKIDSWKPFTETEIMPLSSARVIKLAYTDFELGCSYFDAQDSSQDLACQSLLMAVRMFRIAVRAHPSNKFAWNMLGCSLMKSAAYTQRYGWNHGRPWEFSNRLLMGIRYCWMAAHVHPQFVEPWVKMAEAAAELIKGDLVVRSNSSLRRVVYTFGVGSLLEAFEVARHFPRAPETLMYLLQQVMHDSDMLGSDEHRVVNETLRLGNREGDITTVSRLWQYAITYTEDYKRTSSLLSMLEKKFSACAGLADPRSWASSSIAPILPTCLWSVLQQDTCQKQPSIEEVQVVRAERSKVDFIFGFEGPLCDASSIRGAFNSMLQRVWDMDASAWCTSANEDRVRRLVVVEMLLSQAWVIAAKCPLSPVYGFAYHSSSISEASAQVLSDGFSTVVASSWRVKPSQLRVLASYLSHWVSVLSKMVSCGARAAAQDMEESVSHAMKSHSGFRCTLAAMGLTLSTPQVQHTKNLGDSLTRALATAVETILALVVDVVTCVTPQQQSQSFVARLMLELMWSCARLEALVLDKLKASLVGVDLEMAWADRLKKHALAGLSLAQRCPTAFLCQIGIRPQDLTPAPTIAMISQDLHMFVAHALASEVRCTLTSAFGDLAEPNLNLPHSCEVLTALEDQANYFRKHICFAIVLAAQVQSPSKLEDSMFRVLFPVLNSMEQLLNALNLRITSVTNGSPTTSASSDLAEDSVATQQQQDDKEPNDAMLTRLQHNSRVIGAAGMVMSCVLPPNANVSAIFLQSLRENLDHLADPMFRFPKLANSTHAHCGLATMSALSGDARKQYEKGIAVDGAQFECPGFADVLEMKPGEVAELVVQLAECALPAKSDTDTQGAPKHILAILAKWGPRAFEARCQRGDLELWEYLEQAVHLHKQCSHLSGVADAEDAITKLMRWHRLRVTGESSELCDLESDSISSGNTQSVDEGSVSSHTLLSTPSFGSFRRSLMTAKPYLPPSTLHSGVLIKRGKGLVSNWRTRLVALTLDSIRYFEPKTGDEQGRIHLRSVQTVRAVSGNPGMKFHVVTTARVFIFFANDTNERDLWVKRVALALDGYQRLSARQNSALQA